MELNETTHFFIGFLAFLVMAVGLIGTLLPALPGIELIWLATLGYGVFSGWGKWGVFLFILITLTLVVGEVVIWWLTNTTAAKTGASWQAVLLSIILGLIGMFVIPVVGALIGAMLGVFLVEYRRRRDWREALKATTGVLWGAGLSFGAQVIFALAMMGFWGLWFYLRALEIGV
ncbi:MAG: DUF456 domain-containing protein [Chloroflexi bacterium]|nr:DUF456 domain-containing protein [Chloroflexota bacterium]